MGRSQQDYYVKHDRPKALFVKELKAKRPAQACAPTTRFRGAGGGGGKPGAAAAGAARGIALVSGAHFALGAGLSRTRVESYPLSGALAMVACAHLCGAPCAATGT